MKKRRLYWFLCLVMMFGMIIGATMSAKATTKTITWDSSVLKNVNIGSSVDAKSFNNAGITAACASGTGAFAYSSSDKNTYIALSSTDGCLRFTSSVGKIKSISIIIDSGYYYVSKISGGAVFINFSISGWTFSGMTDINDISSRKKCTITYNGSSAESVNLTVPKNYKILQIGGNISKITFTVDTTATGVSLNKSSTSLTVGGTETLTATVAPSYASDKTVSWSSSNIGVATVDSSGTVTGVAPGTATITVTTTDGSKTATCAVTVSDKITIAKTPKLKKAKAKKGKVTVTWKKIKKTKKTKALLKQIKSIQVQYSTDPTFNTNVASKNVGKKKSSVKLKLQRKTVYYIRMRYVGADGYSNWSNVKTVKTK